MRVNREDLLWRLGMVRPGLSGSREQTEQSSCVVVGGDLFTFNDEVCCRVRSELGDGVWGAVAAEPLVKILDAMPVSHVTLEPRGGFLQIKAKRMTTEVAMETEVVLPVDEMRPPKKKHWRPLDPEFSEAVGVVFPCATRNEAEFNLACVHVHPDFVEAGDDSQFCRWRVKTPIEQPCLVRRESIKHVAVLGMTEIAETDAWLYFRNQNGLIMAVRRFADPYDEIDHLYECEGVKVALPKPLVEGVRRAEIFSADNLTGNSVKVELMRGKVRVKGEGARGRHREFHSTAYDGDPVFFYVAPDVLCDLIERHNEVEIASDRIRADTGKYVYVSSLDTQEEDTGEEELVTQQEGSGHGEEESA